MTSRTGEGRALDELDGLELPGELLALLVRDGALALTLELLEGGVVVPEIELGANDDEGHVGAEVVDLGEPLGGDVLERDGVHHREADQEHVGIGVAAMMGKDYFGGAKMKLTLLG